MEKRRNEWNYGRGKWIESRGGKIRFWRHEEMNGGPVEKCIPRVAKEGVAGIFPLLRARSPTTLETWKICFTHIIHSFP